MCMGTRRRSFALVCVLVLAITAALGVVAPAANAAPGAPSISWSSCNRDLGPFECGIVQVPLDYSDPSDAAISIAVVRLPAADPTHRIGSLFINPGGPGGSGVDFALFAAPFLFSSEVRAKFDIVGFDPRGVARSTALRCFGNAKQWTPVFTSFAFPSTPEEEAVWQAADLFLDGACAQRGGKIIDHMATADVARGSGHPSRGGWRHAAHVRGLLLWNVPWRDLREPVPEPGPCPDRRRRARSDRLVDRRRQRGDHNPVLDAPPQ